MSDDKKKPVITEYHTVFDGTFMGGGAAHGSPGKSVLFRTERHATWSADDGGGLGKPNSWLKKTLYGEGDQVVDTSKLDLSGLPDPAKLMDRLERQISPGVQVYRDGHFGSTRGTNEPITKITVDLPNIEHRVSCDDLKKPGVGEAMAKAHGPDSLSGGQEKCGISVTKKPSGP